MERKFDVQNVQRNCLSTELIEDLSTIRNQMLVEKVEKQRHKTQSDEDIFVLDSDEEDVESEY